MQGGSKQRYTEEKPDCAYCYFYTKKKGCERDTCYYLLSEKPESGTETEETCFGCPYGRHFPCIGYCLLKIVREMKGKGTGRKGEADAG